MPRPVRGAAGGACGAGRGRRGGQVAAAAVAAAAAAAVAAAAVAAARARCRVPPRRSARGPRWAARCGRRRAGPAAGGGQDPLPSLLPLPLRFITPRPSTFRHLLLPARCWASPRRPPRSRHAEHSGGPRAAAAAAGHAVMGGREARTGRRRWLCPRQAAPGRRLRQRGPPMLCSASPLRAPAPLRRCRSRERSEACRASTSRRDRRRAGRAAGRQSAPSATPTAPSSTTMAAPTGTGRRDGGCLGAGRCPRARPCRCRDEPRGWGTAGPLRAEPRAAPSRSAGRVRRGRDPAGTAGLGCVGQAVIWRSPEAPPEQKATFHRCVAAHEPALGWLCAKLRASSMKEGLK